MKNRITTELIFQILILFVCLLTMAFLPKSIFVKAQTSCTQPPFYSEYYRTDWSATLRGSWAQGSQVKITVDNLWNEFDRGQLNQGVKLWGGNVAMQTYSNVSFTSLEPREFTDYSEEAPQDETWIQKTALSRRNEAAIAECAFTYNTAGRVKGANIRVRPDVVNDDYNNFVFVGTHEAGHTFGVWNCTATCTASIMRHAMYQNAAWNGGGPKSCDIERIRRIYAPPSCPNSVPQNNNDSCPSGYTPDPSGARYCCPIPSPTPTPEEQYCLPNPYSNGFINTCLNCESVMINCGNWDYQMCECNDSPIGPDPSPILIDILGNGFGLTNAVNGVSFDITGSGVPKRISWTSDNSDDAWLALDRNKNGLIDNGKELFGNFTTQPRPPAGEERNGFLALSQYDKPRHGGNNNGRVDSFDSVFSQLRLWQDTNHNGVSEQDELRTLTDLGIVELEIDYKESKRTDEFGNQFRYRAKVWDARGTKAGRWAWDVFLQTTP